MHTKKHPWEIMGRGMGRGSGYFTDRTRATLFAAAMTGLLFLPTCERGKPGIVAVTGTVSLDGGPMPAEGTVWFAPVEAAEGFPMRPATGDFGTDGKYRAKSWEPGDGLMPGKYKVYVSCWKVPPQMGGPPAVSHLHRRYQSAQTSGLELTVAPGSGPVVYDLPLVFR